MKTCVLNLFKHPYVCIGINVGAKFEKKECNGISHLLEHVIMACEGMVDLAKDNFVDAITTKEWTYYIIISYQEDMSQEISCFLNCIMKNEIKLQTINIEKNIIISEQMDRSVFARYYQLINRQMHLNTPYELATGGMIESISKLTYKEIVDFYNQNYKNEENIVVYCNDNSVLQIVKNKMDTYSLHDKKREIETHEYLPEDFFAIRKDNRATLVLAKNLFSKDREFKEKIYILNDAIWGRNGLLIEEIKKKFHVYSLKGINDIYEDHVLIGFGVQIDNMHVKAYLEFVCGYINKIIKDRNMIIDIIDKRRHVYLIEKSCINEDIFSRIRWENEIRSLQESDRNKIFITQDEYMRIEETYRISDWTRIAFSDQDTIELIRRLGDEHL